MVIGASETMHSRQASCADQSQVEGNSQRSRADAHVIAERILSITGEDTLSIDRKYRVAWTGRLPTRFLILTNELPKLDDASGALASRFIVLRLVQSFYGKENLTLIGKLLAELPKILGWAMDGRERLGKRGRFIQPNSGQEVANELADLASPVGAFVREVCIVDPRYSTECGKLFSAWVAWCRDNNLDHPGTTQMFSRNLGAAVPGAQTVQRRIPNTEERERVYAGICLRP